MLMPFPRARLFAPYLGGRRSKKSMAGRKQHYSTRRVDAQDRVESNGYRIRNRTGVSASFKERRSNLKMSQ